MLCLQGKAAEYRLGVARSMDFSRGNDNLDFLNVNVQFSDL